MKIRSAYDADYDPSEYFTPGGGEQITDQSQAASCDINGILERFQITGMVDHVAKYEGVYGEADSRTLHEAMNIVADANSMFEELPSKARAHFENDPGKFLDYVGNPDLNSKAAELMEIGLIDPGSETAMRLLKAETPTAIPEAVAAIEAATEVESPTS